VAFDPVARLQEFHEAMGEIPYINRNVLERKQFLALRRKLVTEEFYEWLDEVDIATVTPGKIENFAKEMADMLVVIIGTAQLMDLPIERVFNEVMDSNMSKLGLDGKPLRREDGKILKGPHYRPVDLSWLGERSFS
jgi:NTP pyrophosphatase (non-canonical NTP hydrolase)